MQPRRPVVTGLGLISAAGAHVAAVWDSLQHGRSGLGPLTLFRSNRYGQMPVGQVRVDVDHLAGKARGSRSDKLAWIAAREALTQAGWPQIPRDRLGVVLGATVGGMLGTEHFLQEVLSGQHPRYGPLRFHECISAVDVCAKQLASGGPAVAFSTACSSGALALAAAAEMIAHGEADIVLAGGADSLCRLTLNGFGSLLLLDPHGCRPFDADRAGISIGEGAGMLVLEAAEVAAARGATVLAELTGWGASCDAYHATAPSPDGAGALAAMRQAVERAGIEPAHIQYVNAHGTGTRDNDRMEGRALRQLLGDRLPAVSSTKGFFGHTLGASGAIEAVVSVLALQHQALPPNARCGTPDPEIGVEPVRAYQPATLRHVLSNSFGFGGNNVALVFSLPGITTAPRRITTSNQRMAVVGAGVVKPAADGSFGAEELPAGRRRRLGRLQQMTILAAKRAWPAGADPARTCVAIGTGLGSANEATLFVENMIRKEEREPLPQCFTNAVHNALAAQVAIEFGLKGLNSTPTCREVSFFAALWHAMKELQSGAASLALAGAADEINKYALAAGQRWRQLTTPGEGAAVFALAPTAEKPLGYLHTVRLGRGTGDAAAEARWIAESVPLAEVDLIIGDRRAVPVAAVLGRAVETYPAAWGDHYVLPAFGFQMALERARPGRLVVVYAAGVNGVKGLCAVGG